MYTPSSSIYKTPEVGVGLSEGLTSGHFDRSRPSKKRREVRPYSRHDPARGTLGIQAVGGYKSNEANFMKG